MLDHDRDQADMNDIKDAHELRWRLVKEIPDVHANVRWQPWSRRGLIQANVEAVQRSGRWKASCQIMEPDPFILISTYIYLSA